MSSVVCMHAWGMPPATPFVVIDNYCVPLQAGSAVGLTISYRRKVVLAFIFMPAWLIHMQVACNASILLQTYLPFALGVMTGTILDVLSGKTSLRCPMRPWSFSRHAIFRCIRWHGHVLRMNLDISLQAAIDARSNGRQSSSSMMTQ